MNSNDFVFEELQKMGIDVRGYDIRIHDVGLPSIMLHGGKKITRKTTGLAVHCGHQHDIFLLNTLNDTRRKGTLAHELGHVWLQEHKSPFRNSRVENEGFCELLTYKMYGAIGNLEALALRGGMLLRWLPVYSEGFRIMKRRAEQMGWQAFLLSANGLPQKRLTIRPRFTIREVSIPHNKSIIVENPPEWRPPIPFTVSPVTQNYQLMHTNGGINNCCSQLADKRPLFLFTKVLRPKKR